MNCKRNFLQGFSLFLGRVLGGTLFCVLQKFDWSRTLAKVAIERFFFGGLCRTFFHKCGAGRLPPSFARPAHSNIR